MGFIGGFMKVFNKIMPFAQFIPGIGQILKMAQIALNVVNALSQKPPDWKGALMGAVSAIIPKALGAALKAFPGGTSLDFAKLFGQKFGEKMDSLIDKVMKDTKLSDAVKAKFVDAAKDMKNRVMSDAFQKAMAE